MERDNVLETPEEAEKRFHREVKDYLVHLGYIGKDDDLPLPFVIR